jgi:hypothetical protein
MKKKKPAAKKATTTKKPAAKSAAAKKPAVKKGAPSPAVADAQAPRRDTYTPRPVQGIGWAPFRYPPR